MMTIRELQTQLMDDYGITATWLQTGGGQSALEVRLDDNTWGYVGSNEFRFINKLNVPVSVANLSIDEDGSNYEYLEDLPIERMALKIAHAMLARTGILHP